jgi:hypothetical protein
MQKVWLVFRYTQALAHSIDIETPTVTDDGILTARLHAQAEVPVLFLEQFDHLLSEVDCTGPEMTITIREADSFNQARDACASLVDGLVVSSHVTCSDEGAHSFFR